MDHLAALVAAWEERPSSPVGREALWDEAVRAGLWWAVVETCDEDHPDRMADCLGVADEIVAEMELSPVEPARWTKLMAEGRDAGYRLALAAMDRLEARPDPEPDAPEELPTLSSGPLPPLP